MADHTITLGYTAQHGSNTAYSLAIELFTGDEVPRAFLNSFAFGTSANGTSILTGPAYNEKRVWAISAPLTETQTTTLYNMFKAWDTDRADGKSVACSVVDKTFIEDLTLNAVFSTPPAFTKLGGYGFQADFGLTEV